MRKGGLCSVPGCSRAAVHVHHVVFRSRGGPLEEWNEIGICAVHHLHGIHIGYLEVSGRAGERLEWRLATGEAWVTLGDDDVFRADREGAPGAARARATAPADAPAGGPASGGGTRPGPAAGAHPGDRSTDVNGAARPKATQPGDDLTDVNGAGDRTAATCVERTGNDVTDVDPEATADPDDRGRGLRGRASPGYQVAPQRRCRVADVADAARGEGDLARIPARPEGGGGGQAVTAARVTAFASAARSRAVACR